MKKKLKSYQKVSCEYLLELSTKILISLEKPHRQVPVDSLCPPLFIKSSYPTSQTQFFILFNGEVMS